MNRILLFAVTNIAVLAVLAIASQVLGLDEYLAAQGGMNLTGLLIIAALFGFGGSLISLFMSKGAARRATGAVVIEEPRNDTERWLVSTVKRQAEAAGIGMPEVAIFDSPQPNAFATGAKRDSALVAVSTGLLQHMRPNEVEAVLGHEVAHVANGDMVTMALLQGVLNTFVIFLSRIIGTVVDRAVFKIERGHGPGFFVVSIVAQLVLGVLASIIAMWFSRQREFRADAGGAKLAGTGNMVAALESLRAAQSPDGLPDQLQAFGIAGGGAGGLKRLFMSHPPLEERIATLRGMPV